MESGVRTDHVKWFNDAILLVITLIGVVFGIVIGLVLRTFSLNPDLIMLISYPGELYMRILKLLILPLIISSVIASLANFNAKLNRKIVMCTLLYFIVTSLLNAILGIILVLLIQPGDSEMKTNLISSTENRSMSVLDSLLDLGRNIVPDNLFQTTFQQTYTVYVPDGANNSDAIRQIKYRSGTNTLGIVFFCLIFGTVLSTMNSNPKAQIVIDFFTSLFDIIMKLITHIMWLTPIGISSIIAGQILTVHNIAIVLKQLGWFIATNIIGVSIYQFIILQFLYWCVIGRNPLRFYFGLINALLTAFATASTAAALPITFRCIHYLKIDPLVTRFILPIGCNINMDGTAQFISIATIFIVQLNGIQLNWGEIITICFLSTILSFSSASVPSAALVLLSTVLNAIGINAHDVALLFTVDWIVDRFRTTNNMLGDCFTAAIIEHWYKQDLLTLNKVRFEESEQNNSDVKIV